MIDISPKDITIRTAKAKATIFLADKAFEIIEKGDCKKGDVFTTAKIAAIQAAKSTANMIPLCHQIPIESVEVNFEKSISEKSVIVTVFVKSTGKTGVEMEAICSASVACLTIYDMLKYADRSMTISQVKLIEKTGGKSGNYKRSD